MQGARVVQKPGSALTVADLLECPLWEPVGGDSEVFRQIRTAEPVGEEFRGLVAADFVSPRGARWIGSVTAEPLLPSLWSNGPRLWLEAPAGRLSADPVLDRHTPVLWRESKSIRFSLPLAGLLGDDEVRAISRVAHRLLGVGPGELFPLAVTPRHPVRRWMGAAMLEGFLRPRTAQGQPELIR